MLIVEMKAEIAEARRLKMCIRDRAWIDYCTRETVSGSRRIYY